jgi:hypothetical protein
MSYGLVDALEPAIFQNLRGQRGQLHHGPAIRHLELTIERAPQGARHCRRCADVQGRYVCIPSGAIRNEWRHSDAGLELMVRLLPCRPDSAPTFASDDPGQKGKSVARARRVFR